MRALTGRGALAAVYGATFVAFLDNFAMLPTIGPFARSLGADAAGVGLAVAAYSLANVPGNLLGGLLADRAGRRRVALAGMGTAAAAVACYPLAASLGGLLALRLVHGLAGGVHVAALFTLAGDLAPAGGRGRTMGRMGAVIGTAAIAAPALAGAVRSLYGFPATFALVAVAMLAGLGLLAGRLAEPVRGAGARTARAPLPPPARARLLVACVAVFAFTTGFGVLTGFLPTGVEEAGAPAAVSGGLFAGLALVAVVLMLSRLAGRVDRGRAVPVGAGLALIAAGLAVLAAVPPLPGALAGCLLFGAGFGIVYPAATGAVASVPKASRGRAFGVFNATYSLGFIVGPPVAGRLSLAGVSPYAFAAVVCLACLALAVALGSRGRGGDRAPAAGAET